MALKAIYQIVVDGKDITNLIKDLAILISLDVELTDGKEGDTAKLVLDDKDAQLEFPKCDSEITIALGWADMGVVDVFEGTIDEVRSTGERGGGMLLNISAKSCGTNSKAKEPKSKHWDDTTLGDVLKGAGSEAGYSVSISSELASEEIDYEAMQNESFMAFGQRLAEDYGGTFKIVGKKATMVEANSGQSASGKELAGIKAIWGVNLVSWDIAPIVGRARYKAVKVKYYDDEEGVWKEEIEEIEGDDGAKANCTSCMTAKNKKRAKAKAKSMKKKSEREKGEGDVEIIGEPMAQPEAPCSVICRPGVDGDYKIEKVKHSLNRSGGFSTTLNLCHPKGNAGKDERAKPKAGSNSSPSNDRIGFASPSQRA